MLILLAAASIAAVEAPPPPLRQGLEPLGFLVGHCWRGAFADGSVDTHCFDSIYDGQHVRDRHEVTGGTRIYRGETLYSWDSGAGAVGYTYWNSLGGVSRGTMRARDGGLDFGDESYAGPDGRRITISTRWRRIGGDYEAVSVSPQSPSMNRTVRYVRVAEPVSVSAIRSGDGSHALVHETIVDAPAADVWTAISTVEGWKTWAVPVAWSPADETDLLETSYSPTARPGDPSTIVQRFLARIPNRLLVFRTERAPERFPHFETYRRVTSVIELEPLGESRTRVRLTGAGYADTEAGRQLLAFFREGNRVSLERLRDRFATGPLDWDAVLRRPD
ncbi:SRPBCC family protein [Allosphingosinicella sp.]|jgi:uncharacterized protein YndB with AHSA1/START domain|uniref:SRPBCC family protein n=1 Tax=Allosphingosinicella sp. TaxID=2823234 RepID=UPI002F1C1193